MPYGTWVREGYITATPGNTTDYAFIEHAIIQLAGLYDIRAIGFDRTFAGEIVQHLQGELGEDRLVQHGQGFLAMGSPTAEMLRLIKAGELQHGGNPVLRWNASNLTLATDPAGNIKPDKQRSTEKIDGISGLCMALGVMSQNVNPVPRSVYEDRGLITLGGDLETSGQGEIFRRVKQGW